MRNAASLERLAARQHGIVAVWQVVALGVSRASFARFVHRHGWEQLDHGIWAAPWSRQSFARRCVVVRIRGPRARLITARAQLVLLGVRRQAPSAVDVWVGPDLAPQRRPGERSHRGLWVTGDRVVRIQGIPCTPALRSLRYAAPTSSVERLVKDIAGLDRLRLCTPSEVLADLDDCGPFRGKPALRAAALVAGEELVHSADEGLARRLLRPEGLVLHHRPLPVRHGGRVVGEIDIAVCAARYGVEVDGPWHREDGVVERDRRRDRRLQRLGWVIDRFSDEQVRNDPEGFVRAVRAGHAAAAARTLPPWPCDRCGR